MSNLFSTESPHVEEWFESLTDQQRCYLAAQAAGADSDTLYAIEKPWKYIRESWKLHCAAAAERGDKWDNDARKWVSA